MDLTPEIEDTEKKMEELFKKLVEDMEQIDPEINRILKQKGSFKEMIRKSQEQNFFITLMENMEDPDPEIQRLLNQPGSFEALLKKSNASRKRIQDMAENMKPLDPEFQKVVDDNFWDLVD